MARIAGVDLPAKKRAEIGLTYIYGMGRTRALSLLHRAGVDAGRRGTDARDHVALQGAGVGHPGDGAVG